MSGGGLRPRPSIRTARLEGLADRRDLTRGANTAAAAAWRLAEQLAQPEELAELARLEELAGELEPESPELLEASIAHNRLEERIMGRVSESLAGQVRLTRDALAHGLRALAEQAAREHEEWTPRAAPGATDEEIVAEIHSERIGLERRRSGLASLSWARAALVRSGAAEPISDPEEAGRLLEEITAAIEAGDTRAAEEAVSGR